MSTAGRLLFWPALALVGLTFLVWLRMYSARVGEMRRLRIHPQAIATSAQAAQRLQDTRAADNFRNLFELPVLFYVALGVAWAIDATDRPTLALVWLFVVLRCAHSAIHCSYNRVLHRFAAYVAGGAVLWLLWAWLAWKVAQ